jgi:tRNA(Met) cytidine acetyltransferase
VFSDALQDLDLDVARAALRACGAAPPLDLGERDWRVVAGAAHGPGMYGVDPEPFRDLAAHHLVAGDDDDLLSPGEERLLVGKLLQARPWDDLADRLSFHSTSQAMRALGDALQPLVVEYGTEAARDELGRFED